jgi:hypothetical protein
VDIEEVVLEAGKTEVEVFLVEAKLEELSTPEIPVCTEDLDKCHWLHWPSSACPG